jgi:hypothetical protein
MVVPLPFEGNPRKNLALCDRGGTKNPGRIIADAARLHITKTYLIALPACLQSPMR